MQQAGNFSNNDAPVFSPLVLPKKRVSVGGAIVAGYRVFSSATESEVVEAQTVVEALEKSTIKQPVKVEKIGFERVAIYCGQELVDVQPPVSEAAAPAAPDTASALPQETVDSSADSATIAPTTQGNASPAEGQS